MTERVHINHEKKMMKPFEVDPLLDRATMPMFFFSFLLVPLFFAIIMSLIKVEPPLVARRRASQVMAKKTIVCLKWKKRQTHAHAHARTHRKKINKDIIMNVRIQKQKVTLKQ